MLQLLKKEPVTEVKLQPAEKQSPPMSVEELLSSIREVEQAILRNEVLFNMALDDDLIDACILERKALEHRYEYYRKIARDQGLQCPMKQLARFALR